MLNYDNWQKRRCRKLTLAKSSFSNIFVVSSPKRKYVNSESEEIDKTRYLKSFEGSKIIMTLQAITELVPIDMLTFLSNCIEFKHL